MPDFEIEGYQFCFDCNTFVENDHYNSNERLCYGCIGDEIEEDEARLERLEEE